MEGRSGDGLSACAAEIALLDRFQHRPSSSGGLVAGFIFQNRSYTSYRSDNLRIKHMQPDTKTLLLDHVDMRPVTTEADVEDRNALVTLDPDHPGFRDPDYRARRNQIAQTPLGYTPAAPNTN